MKKKITKVSAVVVTGLIIGLFFALLNAQAEFISDSINSAATAVKYSENITDGAILHSYLNALERGDDTVVDEFIANPSKFLGNIPQPLFVKRLLEEWHLACLVDIYA